MVRMSLQEMTEHEASELTKNTLLIPNTENTLLISNRIASGKCKLQQNKGLSLK